MARGASAAREWLGPAAEVIAVTLGGDGSKGGEELEPLDEKQGLKGLNGADAVEEVLRKLVALQVMGPHMTYICIFIYIYVFDTYIYTYIYIYSLRSTRHALHGGLRSVHQMSTCITLSTLGPDVIQIWSRNVRISDRTNLAKSTVWSELCLNETGLVINHI